MTPQNKPRATGGEKARAYRLRKAIASGARVSDVDRLWVADFDERHPPRGGGPTIIDTEPVTPGSTDHGRSRSGRKVKFEMEEAAEAEGTGAAAPTAASAAITALTAREEGRRVDSLTMNALATMEAACSSWERMNAQLLGLLTNYQEHHLHYLDQLREAHLARTEAEAETLTLQAAQSAGGDPAKDMMTMVLMKHLGIELPAGMDPAAVFREAQKNAGAGKKPPPANGATKR